ncbi:MAG: alpha/beta hydrolase-fold protein [Planctomycetota bacterium]
MPLAIRALDKQPAPSRAEIQRFFETHEFPIVEGTHVTFAYHGEADAVHLRHWVFGLPSLQSFRRIPETQVWYLTVELPRESRVEYKISVEHGGGERWIRDPLNPRQARDPFGANSVCVTTGYELPEWTRRDPRVGTGTFERFSVPSPALGENRGLTVYLPARFRPTRRYPLLIVHDGRDFLEYAAMATILDNLIYRHEVAPMIVAFSDPGNRMREYAADRAHATHLVEELLPALEGRYPLKKTRQSRGLIGASFGAVASLASAWYYPGVFERLFLLSGSFAFTDIGKHARSAAFDPVVEFVNAFRENPGRPAEKIFVSCGVYESLIYENRSLVPFLQSTGVQVKYEEARDGHNWENWRDRLRDGLSWLFPGPLWMVYE